jgi:hypothetical protein
MWKEVALIECKRSKSWNNKKRQFEKKRKRLTRKSRTKKFPKKSYLTEVVKCVWYFN